MFTQLDNQSHIHCSLYATFLLMLYVKVQECRIHSFDGCPKLFVRCGIIRYISTAALNYKFEQLLSNFEL